MGKKLFLNTLYNICIFLCLIIGYNKGFDAKEPNHYIYLAGAVVFIAIFIVLKVKLLKQVKEAQKKP